MGNIKLLRKELWDLMCGGDVDSIKEIVGRSNQDERMGEIEDRLRSAVRKSSVGLYGGDLYYFGGRLYEKVSRYEWCTVLTDLLYYDACIRKVDYKAAHFVIDRATVLSRSKHLELQNNLMVFRNGVLDTETMKFYKKFDRCFVQLWGVDYDYNPNARTFLWYQFINQVLPNKELQEVLQMFLGATFVDRRKVRIEHLLILLGRGANGKGVVNQVIKGVLGDNMSAEGIGNLCAKGLEGMSALARINGKRLNFGTEMSVSDFRRRDARLKTLISGEPTTARMLYGQPFEASDIPLLMSSANMIPAFDVDDDALIRRIYPIPFDVVIPPEKRNPELAGDMVAEYPGIFNWIMEGRRKFVENGYRLHDHNMLKDLLYKEVESYDTALKFMAKKGFRAKMKGVDLAPRNYVRVKDLYDEYVRWTRNNGIHTEGRTTFLKSLEKGGFVKARHSDGLVVWVFGDITLRNLRDEAKRVRDRELKDKAPDSSIMSIDGELWTTSMNALGAYVGASLRAVEKVNREGGFEGCTKSWKMRTLYNIEKCRDVLMGKRVIATDEEKERHKRMLYELRQMRGKFNTKMKYHNLPYRKYAKEDQIDENVIVIPDETTLAEALAMAERDLGYVNTRIQLNRDDYEQEEQEQMD